MAVTTVTKSLAKMSSTQKVSEKTQEIIQEEKEKEESILLSNLKQVFQEFFTKKEGDMTL